MNFYNQLSSMSSLKSMLVKISEQSRVCQSLRYPDLLGIRHLHYIHVGKCAGRSIKKVIHLASSEFDIKNAKYKLIPHTHFFAIGSLPIGSSAFISIRDPISRFVSAFESRKHKLNNASTQYVGDAWVFKKYPDVNCFAESLFADECYKQAVSALPHIRQPLDYFLGKECNENSINKIKVVLEQESLVSDLEFLLKISYPKVSPNMYSMLKDLRENSNTRFTSKTTAQIVQSLSSLAHANLNKLLENDYRIYNLLLKRKHLLLSL